MQRRTSRLAENPALDFLLSRIDYERTSSVPYDQRDFQLDRMRQLLERLGNPQDSLAIVHVAGTKGKGSTAATIASILGAAGLRTGLYSSPHLDRVEERMMIGRAICPSDELIELINRMQPVVAAMDAEPTPDAHLSNRPTYFEIITALALLRFAEHRVDAAVLEVGLGGRLDSTNVCRPLVSVITSISYDHTQQLGNTLAAIAAEKAGIIKRHTPVVSGVVNNEPRGVIASVARDRHCRLTQLGVDFDFHYVPPRGLDRAPARGHMDFSYRVPGAEYAIQPFERLERIELNLAGAHQAANAAVALATIAELRRMGWNISEAAIRQGLTQVRWPARIEVLSRNPTVVLDAAHNVASVEALVDVLEESFSSPARILIFATTRDKDVRGMLRVLLPKFEKVIFTRYWNNPRAMPPSDLEALAGEISPARRHQCGDAATAWKLASHLATPNHLVCITGSFFIAAEMRAAMQEAARADLDEQGNPER